MDMTTETLFTLLNTYYERLTTLTSNPAALPDEIEEFFCGYINVEQELTRRGMRVPVKFTVES